MIVGIFTPRSIPKLHTHCLEAFREGLDAVKQRCFVRRIEKGWKKCDVAVTFGIEKLHLKRGVLVGKVIERQRRYGGQHIVVERGFVKRDCYFMVGWGGLNGRADFNNLGMPGDRFEELDIVVKPWTSSGESVLVCGQVPWDSAVQHFDFQAWVDWTIQSVAKLTDQEIVFRPHPMSRGRVKHEHLPCRESTSATMEEDLEAAFCTMTANSNSGVESAINGVPTFVFDRGAMAMPVANTNLSQLGKPLKPDRQQWLNDLAYAQWTIDEMRQGLSWNHLTTARFPKK